MSEKQWELTRGEAIQIYKKFLENNFQWLINGEGAPNDEIKKLLLQRLWDSMVKLDHRIQEFKKQLKWSAWTSPGVDIADYLRSEFYWPIQEFSRSKIARDPEEIEYEVKEFLKPKLASVSDEFYEYQSYVQLLELKDDYMHTYRRLEQILGWEALQQVHKTHFQVEQIIPE